MLPSALRLTPLCDLGGQRIKCISSSVGPLVLYLETLSKVILEPKLSPNHHII